MSTRTLYLASASPRRKLLLEQDGFAPVVIPSGVDDAELRHNGGGPEAWTTALAYLKASAGLRRLKRPTPIDAIVLGADTVVVKKDEVIGQPRDESDARRILELLEDGEHRVVSGVAILIPGKKGRPKRRLLADVARVRVGRLGPERIGAYLSTQGWRGKAGAYNLSERIQDGWPVSCEGDPSSVMGLPMRRLGPMLRELLGEPT